MHGAVRRAGEARTYRSLLVLFALAITHRTLQAPKTWGMVRSEYQLRNYPPHQAISPHCLHPTSTGTGLLNLLQKLSNITSRTLSHTAKLHLQLDSPEIPEDKTMPSCGNLLRKGRTGQNTKLALLKVHSD